MTQGEVVHPAQPPLQGTYQHGYLHPSQKQILLSRMRILYPSSFPSCPIFCLVLSLGLPRVELLRHRIYSRGRFEWNSGKKASETSVLPSTATGEGNFLKTRYLNILCWESRDGPSSLHDVRWEGHEENVQPEIL